MGEIWASDPAFMTDRGVATDYLALFVSLCIVLMLVQTLHSAHLLFCIG